MKLFASLLAALLVNSFCLSATALEKPDFYAFPAGFLWGTATAAYQVEGGIQNDWSVAGLDAGKAAEHARRYEEDFDTLEKLGTPAYRMSIEWAKLEPEPGKYNRQALEDYRKMLKSLNRRGIQPMVTLFHFTLPTWFAQKGGWTRPENIQDFVRFSTWVSAELKDEVHWWFTLNEPLVYAFKCYDSGAWPPFQKDRNLALRVIKHLILAHAQAYRAVHAQDPIAWVGFAKNITLLEPNLPGNPLDQAMTAFQSYLFNEAFWDAISQGELHFSLPGVEPIEIPYNKALHGSMDFVAFNYYTRYMITATGAQVTRPGVPVNELNWEIYPEGLLKVLRMANKHAQRLHVPIMISENGLADADDSQRKAFLLQHLHQIWQGIQEGIPVSAYMHWSLMDNYEWADGFEAKFGLLDIQRQWRPSGLMYQEIVQKNGFPSAWLEQHPLPSR